MLIIIVLISQRMNPNLTHTYTHTLLMVVNINNIYDPPQCVTVGKHYTLQFAGYNAGVQLRFL